MLVVVVCGWADNYDFRVCGERALSPQIIMEHVGGRFVDIPNTAVSNCCLHAYVNMDAVQQPHQPDRNPVAYEMCRRMGFDIEKMFVMKGFGGRVLFTARRA